MMLRRVLLSGQGIAIPFLLFFVIFCGVCGESGSSNSNNGGRGGGGAGGSNASGNNNNRFNNHEQANSNNNNPPPTKTTTSHRAEDALPNKLPGTELTTDPFRNLLVISTLDGTLTALDRVSGELRWISKDDKPMIQVPHQSENQQQQQQGTTKAPYFLPDPKTGSLYMMGKQNSLRKLPFTIPQLVAMAPCRNSEGLMYTGRKMDMWLMLNPFTGEKSEIPADGDGTCPAWSADYPGGSESESCSAENPTVRKRLVKSLLIGKTEYTLSMMDGPRKWNVTYHHYSSKDMNQQSLQDYELVHFTSPSQGSLMTYDRVSGDLLWGRELDSPVIAMYTIDGTSTNLVSVPFNPIASDTLNRLKSSVTDASTKKPLNPTTYVGECAYGVYAVPALADEHVLMITEGSKLPPLLEGPVGPIHEKDIIHEDHGNGNKNEDYLLLGFYEVNEGSGGAAAGSTTSQSHPAMQIESESSVHQHIPSGAFNESGFIEDGKVIPIVDNENKDNKNDDMANKTPNKPQFPPPPEQARKKVGKEEIKIVVTTAVFSVGITVFILGLVFIAYRRYKNNQLEQQKKLLSSDSGLLSGSNNEQDNNVATGGSTSSEKKLSLTEDGLTELTVGKISLFQSEVLGKGCEGTFVFKGKFEGRDVAVKRILPECFQFADREVDLLKESDQHPNVVRYFCTETDGQFRYIALELCIATLHDWVEGKYDNSTISPSTVLREASEGLAYLHSLRIVHRDVKPANVLLSLTPGTGVVRTMISDFGLCKKLQNGRMSFSRRSGGIPGTDGWIAPEVVRNGDGQVHRMTYSVDIFSMGCVYYYVLTGGQHPFGDAFRRQSNILNGEYDLERIRSNPQGAYDLVRVMISSSPSERPPLSGVLSHPMFWSRDKMLSFFLDVSDRIEKESEDTFPLLKRLEAGAGEIVKQDWRDHICPEVAMDLRKYRTYKGHSIRDLLRALRNKKNHYRELTLEAQQSLGNIPDQFVQYWVSRFPLLLPYTWTRFETLKSESVFSKYYPKGFEFSDVLLSPDEIVPYEDDLEDNDENAVMEPNNIQAPAAKQLDRDFWKSKSQAKYQKWRSRRGAFNNSPADGAVVTPRTRQFGAAGSSPSPHGSPRHYSTQDDSARGANNNELSASTDNYWRSKSPAKRE